MKKTVSAFKKHSLTIIEKFVPVLLLQRHTFEIEKLEENGSTGYFECVFNYPYLNARIRFSQRAFKDWQGGKDITPFIVHEMCHLITDPFYAKAVTTFRSKSEIEDERERLTDLICNIVLKTKK